MQQERPNVGQRDRTPPRYPHQQQRHMKILLKTYYETWTPEDLEIGETDDKGLEGEQTFTLDDHQDEEDPEHALAEQVASEVCNAGAGGASSSPVDPTQEHMWWNSVDPDHNFTTGEQTFRSFHIEGPAPMRERIHREIARRLALDTK